jgi:spermidine synthase
VSQTEDWFAEPAFRGYQQRYRVRQRLHAEQTAFQTLEILELESVGRALILGGTLQTSQSDEFTYHEPLVHTPLFAHANPHRVLIIGGGDGGALRHALLHPSVDRAVVVEIDLAVVAASRKYLAEVSGNAYTDPRTEVLIQDGARLVAETSERFDVILVDSTDPVGPARALVTDEFLQGVRRALAPGGLIAMQSGSPLTQPTDWLSTVRAFRKAFPIVRPYLSWVPIYPGVIWSWVIGSDEVDPMSIDDVSVNQRLDAMRDQLRIYNPAWHRAAFALPTFLQRLLETHLERDEPLTPADLHTSGHPFF